MAPAASAQLREELVARRQRKAVLLAGAERFNKTGPKEGLAYFQQSGVITSLSDAEELARYVAHPTPPSVIGFFHVVTVGSPAVRAVSAMGTEARPDSCTPRRHSVKKPLASFSATRTTSRCCERLYASLTLAADGSTRHCACSSSPSGCLANRSKSSAS